MLGFLVLVASTLAGDEVRHAEPWTVELTPEASVRSATYRVTAATTLHVWAESDADLILRVRSDAGLAKEDDDSGGGSSPYLELQFSAAAELDLEIEAKSLEVPALARLHVFEMKETEETRSLSARVNEGIRSGVMLSDGNSDAPFSEIWEAILECEVGERSAELLAALLHLEDLLLERDRPELAAEVQAHLLEIRLAQRPREHRSVLAQRQALGASLFGVGDIESAREQFEIVVAVRLRDLPGESRDLWDALLNAGTTAFYLGDLQLARSRFEKLASLQEPTLSENDPERLITDRYLAAVLVPLGENEAALDLLQHIHELLSQSVPPEDRDLLAVSQDLASVLGELGRFEEALELIEPVLDTLSRILPADHPDLLAILTNTSVLYSRMGDYDRAATLGREAAAGYERAYPPDHPDVLSARANLADVYYQEGDLSNAKAIAEDVLERRVRVLGGDHPYAHASRLNLSAILYEAGDYQGARVLCEQVLAGYSRALPDSHPALQSARLNLAQCLFSLEDFDSAQTIVLRVLEVAEENHDTEQKLALDALTSLGLLALVAGEFEEAREILQNVVAARQRATSESNPDRLESQDHLATALVCTQDLDGARQLLEENLGFREGHVSPGHPILQDNRIHLAWVLARQGEWDRAEELIREFVRDEAEELSRTTFYSIRELEARSAYAAIWLNQILSASASWPADHRAGLESLLFEIIEANRSAPSLAARTLRASAESRELDELRRQLGMMATRLTQLSRTEDRQTFAETVRQRDRLERELAKLSEVPIRPTLDMGVKLAEQQGPKEAAVSIWRYHRTALTDPGTPEPQPVPSYCAWVLRAGQVPTRVELGPAAPIEEAIQSWRAMLLEERPSPASTMLRERLGKTIVRLVIAPLNAVAGDCDRWVLAPGDALCLLPFEVLPMDEGRLLGDIRRIHYRSFLSEPFISRETSEETQGLLALGGISYSAKVPATDELRGAPSLGLRGGAKFRFSFERLASTEEEVTTIARLFEETHPDGSHVSLLTGAQARRTTFEESAPKFRYLHVATHGWFAPESVTSTADTRVVDHRMRFGEFSSQRERVSGLAPSILCGLAFAGANVVKTSLGHAPGILTAEELRLLDLSGVELAVLSACETNIGLRRGGQSLASLQSALHTAGVRSAITSLWKVPDAPTLELMTELYRRLWVLKEPKADALWNAKQLLRNAVDAEGRPKYRPRDWAAWVLSGDPD
ncbi:MAG: tetratricopeptide repeat protein [Planctomycetota bacterium]